MQEFCGQKVYMRRDDLPVHLQHHCSPVEGTGLHVFHHQYCISIFPMVLPLTIEAYIEEREAEAMRAWQEHGVDAYLSRMERPYRLSTLLSLVEDGYFNQDPHTYWKLVGKYWIDSEIDESDPVWGQLLAIHFEGRASMMSRKERAALEAMPDMISVYRGVQGKDRILAEFSCHAGHSWSTDRNVAVKFALRHASNTSSWVTHCQVPKTLVVAYLTHRGESEIILRPRDIRDLSIEFHRVDKRSQDGLDFVEVQEADTE